MGLWRRRRDDDDDDADKAAISKEKVKPNESLHKMHKLENFKIKSERRTRNILLDLCDEPKQTRLKIGKFVVIITNVKF